MRRQFAVTASIGASGCLWMAALLAQSSPASSQQPTFRVGVDLVQVDVSVLDKRRKPEKNTWRLIVTNPRFRARSR